MTATRGLVPKICGADIEISNFVMDGSPHGSGSVAARELLAALHQIVGGVSDWRSHLCDPDGGPTNHQDWRRSYFPSNGACAYIDLEHLELCLPEVRSAWDHVAAWHAMLRLTQRALAEVNTGRHPREQVFAGIGNGDGAGNSWGSHLNFLISRRAWDELVYRRPHYQGWLAAFQISAMAYTGQGRIGSHVDPLVKYQISQRADFFETLAAPQTTFRRPIINTRDEPLCGRADRAPASESSGGHYARLHVISLDSTVAEVPCLLRVGPMQILLAMLEAGLVRPELALDDPLTAVRRWSHDPWLTTEAPLAGGGTTLMVDLQRRFFDDAAQFVAAGRCDTAVPGASAILAEWGHTLDLLARRDWPALARRLDWVLKLSLVEQARQQQGSPDWSTAALRRLDQEYGNLDRRTGPYWSFLRRGLVDRVVDDGRIDHLTKTPPADTRAWGRAMLLRRVPRHAIDGVDWDNVRFELRGPGGPSRWRVDLGTPLDGTQADLGDVLTDPMDAPIADWLVRLGAKPEPWGAATPIDPSTEHASSNWSRSTSQPPNGHLSTDGGTP